MEIAVGRLLQSLNQMRIRLGHRDFLPQSMIPQAALRVNPRGRGIRFALGRPFDAHGHLWYHAANPSP
ncbi:MAG: hypothetical protein Kow00123_17350 [Anaerolineales bacterium]